MTSSFINSVSQVALRVQGTDPEATFSSVRQEILRWLSGRAGGSLPPEAWEGKSFELFREVSYQPIAAVALESPRFWACRLDDADKQVPKWSWTTEVGLGLGPDGAVHFGCRLSCITLGDNPAFLASIPGFVRQLVDCFEAQLDGGRVRCSATEVGNATTTEWLLKLLLDRSRSHPVIVVSCGTREKPLAPPLVDADRLAARLVGTPHVVRLQPAGAALLGDYLGREFSVFNRGIRTFQPHLDPDYDQPSRHPVASPTTIEIWDGLEGLEDWCRSYLAGNIVVLPRALRAAKKAEYQEPALAYKALLLLKDRYVALRTEGGDSAK